MVILAAIFSESPLYSSAGSAIHIGPTVLPLVFVAVWWIFSFAAFSLLGAGVRGLFRGEGLRFFWGRVWRAALCWVASMAICFVWNVWIHPR